MFMERYNHANTHPTATPPPTPTGTPLNPVYVPLDYGTIQDAIDASNHGDTIVALPGIYRENIRFKGKNIVLRSIDPGNEDYVNGTIIDGGHYDAVVTFSGDEDWSCELSGFTIRHGKESTGGGINGNRTDATIQYNIIQYNETKEADYIEQGGGICDCNGYIYRNIIRHNSAIQYGGGLSGCNGLIYCNRITHNETTFEDPYSPLGGKGGGLWGCQGDIIGNTISYNSSKYQGGGLSFCNGLINNNIISNNSALMYCDIGSKGICGSGGGMYDCNGIIHNNVIYLNAAVGGHGLCSCDGCILNNIIWGEDNSERQMLTGSIPHYCCLSNPEDGEGGEGNIFLDPLFTDPPEGDFHLRNDSPCIDQGNPNPDYNDSCLPPGKNTGRGDMGAYGGEDNCIWNPGPFPLPCKTPLPTPSPSPTPTPGNVIKVPEEYSTIQSAIDAASNGDEILVYPGIYGGSINICGKNILLKAKVPYNCHKKQCCIIDGGSSFPCIVFQGDEQEDCIITGFVIQNGYNQNGGGITGNYTKATIQNNLIQNNTAEDYGGGLYQCSGLIQNNLIIGNSATSGGGLYECPGKIYNNTFYKNTAGIGAAIRGPVGEVINCIIWENDATDSYGNQVDLYTWEDRPIFCLIQDWESEENGIFMDDPLLVDPENGNYELSDNSPCIDHGFPGWQYEDANLPPGKGFPRGDLGAFGGPGNSGWEIAPAITALAELKSQGDVWIAVNNGIPPFEQPSRWGWLGFRYDPANNWLPLCGNAKGWGASDLIQVTEYGDAWVSINYGDEMGKPVRWGWLGFRYDEKNGFHGWYPLSGDVDNDGDNDLIQVTEYGDAWVALSSETTYEEPKRWAWLGYRFSRGSQGTHGALPLAGDANGDGLCDLVQVTEYGDAWVALSSTESVYTPAERWAWLGFHYSPFDGWYPLCSDVNGDGKDDLVQITPTGDPWVSLSQGTYYASPARWGWLGVYYQEAEGYYPLTGDVNGDGKADLIQINPAGESWVSLSLGDGFEPFEDWGAPDFIFSRENNRLPLFIGY